MSQSFLFGINHRNATIAAVASNNSRVFKEKPSKMNFARLSSKTMKKTSARIIRCAFKARPLSLFI
jgi:hypothetical protein